MKGLTELTDLASGVTDFKAVKGSYGFEEVTQSPTLHILVLSTVGSIFVILAGGLCLVLTCRRKVRKLKLNFHQCIFPRNCKETRARLIRKVLLIPHYMIKHRMMNTSDQIQI